MIARTLPAALFGILIALATPAHAGISLNNAVVDFKPGERPVQDVVVTNHGDKTEYISVKVQRVIEPGTDDEAGEDVAEDDKQLIIAPRKMAIPAGGRQSLRIVSKHKTHINDVIYRVTVTPVNAQEVQAKGNLGLKVVIAYGILVIVRPRQLNVVLDGQRSGKQLRVSNKGNTNIELRAGEQCAMVDGARTCEKVTGERLYPGREMTISLPFDAPLQLGYRVAGESFSRVFP